MRGSRGTWRERHPGECRAVGTRPAGECWGGGLPGLGSGMVRGPYARWQPGQALDLPAISTSGPLALPDAGPGPGRYLKTRRPAATSHRTSAFPEGHRGFQLCRAVGCVAMAALLRWCVRLTQQRRRSTCSGTGHPRAHVTDVRPSWHSHREVMISDRRFPPPKGSARMGQR